MPEETKTNDKNKQAQDQIKNFMMFQKLMGEQLKQKISLDPYMKGVSGALKKLGEKDATEASMQIGADKTAEQFNKMAMGTMTTTGDMAQQSQSGQQPQQGVGLLERLMQQKKPELLPAKNMFSQSGITPEGNIQMGGFFNVGPSYEGLATLQKLVGQEPMQMGKIQESIITEVVKADQEGRLKPNDIFTKYEQASNVFEIARDAQARIEAIQTGTGFDDLGLIFSYMKVLDPQSVVRESEFRNAEEAASFLQRKYGKIVKFTKGGRLSPTSRKELIDTSRRLFKAAQNQQEKTTQMFSQIAVRNNINPKNVIRDVGINLPQEQAKQQTQPGVKANIKSITPWRE